jgi:glutathione S-transferase
LTDGDISIFEGGAILLRIGNRSDKVMPTSAAAQPTTPTPPFSKTNSSLLASSTWTTLLAKREWLAGTFAVADIVMADVVDQFDGLSKHTTSAKAILREQLAGHASESLRRPIAIPWRPGP